MQCGPDHMLQFKADRDVHIVIEQSVSFCAMQSDCVHRNVAQFGSAFVGIDSDFLSYFSI